MDISKLAVILTASSAGFVAGMKKAEDSAGHFGEALKTAAEVTGILALADAAVEGFSKIAEMTHASLEAIDANAKLSDSLGISTEALTHLQYSAKLAGVSNEALAGGIGKLLKNLGGAADLTEQSAGAFGKLGLSAAELAAMPTDQALAKVAGALQAITNPAQRAAAAQQIFGKGAQELMPLLLTTTEELKSQGHEADNLGASYNRIDAAKVEAANDSMTRVGAAITGVFNRLAISAAPFIEAVSNELVKLAAQGEGLGPIVVDAFEMITKGVAQAADYVHLLEAGWYGLKGTVLVVVGGVVKAIDLLGQGQVDLLNLLPGVEIQWTSTFGNIADAMAEDAVDAFDKAGKGLEAFSSGESGKAAGRLFDDIRQKAEEAAKAIADAKAKNNAGPFINTDGIEKAGKILADLQKQVDEFGLTEGEKKVAELKAAGASPEDIARAEQLVANLEGLQNIKKAQDEATEAAKKYYEETRTPAEKYQAELTKVNELVAANMLDEQTAARERLKLADDYEKATGGKLGETAKDTAPASVDIVASGSQEAAKLVAQFQNGGGGTQQGILQASRKSNDLLNKIAVNTSGFSAPAVFSIGA